jgi:hypothetical protein
LISALITYVQYIHIILPHVKRIHEPSYDHSSTSVFEIDRERGDIDTFWITGFPSITVHRTPSSFGLMLRALTLQRVRVSSLQLNKMGPISVLMNSALMSSRGSHFEQAMTSHGLSCAALFSGAGSAARGFASKGFDGKVADVDKATTLRIDGVSQERVAGGQEGWSKLKIYANSAEGKKALGEARKNGGKLRVAHFRFDFLS